MSFSITQIILLITRMQHINVLSKTKIFTQTITFLIYVIRRESKEELIEKMMGVTKKGLKIVAGKKKQIDETD